jgi:uncharacterized protein (DUF1499 family)
LLASFGKFCEPSFGHAGLGHQGSTKSKTKNPTTTMTMVPTTTTTARIIIAAVSWMLASSNNNVYFQAAEAFRPSLPSRRCAVALSSSASKNHKRSSSSNSGSSTFFSFPTAVRNSRQQQQQHSEECPNDTEAKVLRRKHDSNNRRRRQLLHDGLLTILGLTSSLGMQLTNDPAAWASDDVVAPPTTVAMCEKTASTGNPVNCVSTASIRQFDSYAPPWTWQDDRLSADAIIARLKGAIAVDPNLTLIAQTSDTLVVTAARNAFCTDQIIFRVNGIDRAVTFSSRQISGPDGVSDFGANRKRLERIRQATKVLSIMGSELDSADATAPRESVTDQLKAFWGLQSGGGYESVLLDEDEAY